MTELIGLGIPARFVVPLEVNRIVSFQSGLLVFAFGTRQSNTPIMELFSNGLIRMSAQDSVTRTTRVLGFTLMGPEGKEILMGPVSQWYVFGPPESDFVTATAGDPRGIIKRTSIPGGTATAEYQTVAEGTIARHNHVADATASKNIGTGLYSPTAQINIASDAGPISILARYMSTPTSAQRQSSMIALGVGLGVGEDSFFGVATRQPFFVFTSGTSGAYNMALTSTDRATVMEMLLRRADDNALVYHASGDIVQLLWDPGRERANVWLNGVRLVGDVAAVNQSSEIIAAQRSGNAAATIVEHWRTTQPAGAPVARLDVDYLYVAGSRAGEAPPGGGGGSRLPSLG